MSDDRSTLTIGQPNNLQDTAQNLRDTNRGNIYGDVVDNTVSANEFSGVAAQGRGTGMGAYLGMQSMAPCIINPTKYNNN
jgi:hypothetical protein